MKRGFVYGIGTYFLLAAIWFPTVPANRYYLIQLDELTVAFELALVVAAVVAFYAATFLAPRRSWWHALLGGAFGFGAAMAAVLALLAVMVGADTLTSSRPKPVAPPCISGTDCR